jgi:hypothetical protein
MFAVHISRCKCQQLIHPFVFLHFITTQTFSVVYESCLLTFRRPSLTADRPVAKFLPTNDYTNTETDFSYVHALNGIRNQEPSVVVPAAYDGQSPVL